jgi:hypothetical protein
MGGIPRPTLINSRKTALSRTEQPAPKKSRKALYIILTILAVLFLACCGGSAALMFFGGKTVAAMAVMGSALPMIQNDEEVLAKLGENVQPTGMPSASSINMREGATSTVDFEVAGAKGTGSVHVEAKSANGVVTPTLIRVSSADGWVREVDVSE